jgi:peptidyl-tRNA hydrolase
MMNHPTLYILMRTDMESMNPGKAMAQAAHAANAFIKNARDNGSATDDWEDSTDQGFGTTITLAVNSEVELRQAAHRASLDGFRADVVRDPTYPVRDGKVTHLVPVDTCAYVYTTCRESRPVTALAGLKLHP